MAKISMWTKCRSLSSLPEVEPVALADYAAQKYLSVAQVYRQIAYRQVVAKKIKGKWYIYPDSSDSLPDSQRGSV